MAVDLAPSETSTARFERRFRLAVILSLIVHGLILAVVVLTLTPSNDAPPTIAADFIVETPPAPPPAQPAQPPPSPPPQQTPQVATQAPAPAPPPASKPNADSGLRAAMPAFTVRPNDFQRAGENWLPVYPEAARANKLQGQVVVTVDVDATGRPVRVVVSRSSGHANLDEAARQAVRFWKFRPPRYNGRPVTATVDIPFDFKL